MYKNLNIKYIDIYLNLHFDIKMRFPYFLSRQNSFLIKHFLPQLVVVYVDQRHSETKTNTIIYLFIY